MQSVFSQTSDWGFDTWLYVDVHCSLQNEFLSFNEGIVKFVTFTIVSLQRFFLFVGFR